MSTSEEPCNGSEEYGPLELKDAHYPNAYTYNQPDTGIQVDSVGFCQTKSHCGFNKESLKSDISSEQPSLGTAETGALAKGTLYTCFPNASLRTEKRKINNFVALLKNKCCNSKNKWFPVVTLRDVAKDLNLLSNDMQNNGVRLSCDGSPKRDPGSFHSKMTKSEGTGLQSGFFSSVVLAGNPAESALVASGTQMASRRQAMDRGQRKDGADPCERSRHGEFGKFNAGVEALISPAVPNNTFFEDVRTSPDHRRHVHCESARDTLLKHEQGDRKLSALLGDTTCKKYALRNKPMVQYGLEQVEYERYYKAVSVPVPAPVPVPVPVSVPSVSAQACLDYGATPRLPLKGTMLSKSPKYKCKGSRKMLVKLSRVNIEKYLLQAERKSKGCHKLVAHNSLGSGVKVQFISVPEGDSTAAKKGRRNKVTLLPTGDVPVVKRKRGRPRKVVPEGGGEPANHVKRKPRHHKLSPPQPTYIAGCNDSAADYADVLSKLAFLTKQSLILGRCSPPRCWSPSEPGSMQRSAALHHDMSHFYRTLAGTRRRGGKAGCSRGRQLGQLAESSSTFSDFFEGIGKRKRVFLGETKLYARKCKWGTEMKEKPVQRRKPYKRTPHFPEHGIFHGMGAGGGDSGDWARQAGDSCWPGGPGYQAKQLRNGLFSSSSSSYPGMSAQSFPSTVWDARSVSRNGYLMGRMSTGQAGAAHQSPASIAGYFRSLLDSDDSSDLMDVSFSQAGQETCGIAGAGGGVGGGGGGSFGSTPPSRHLTHFQETFDKTNPPNCSQPAGGQSAAAATYPLMGSENSDSLDYASSFHSSETDSFQRVSAQTSLPRQAGHSCQQTCDNFGHYGNYRLRAQGFSGSDTLQTSREFASLDFLGTRDCTFGFEASNTSQASSSSSAAADPYTQHTMATKLHFNASSPFNSSSRPDPRSPMSLQTPLASESQSDSACSMDHPSSQKYFGSTQLSSDGRVAFFRGLQLSGKSGFNLPEGCMGHFNHRYSPVLDYNSLNESKDILDISNYTPRKAKVRPLPDTLAESSSHFNATFANADGGGNEEKSSLSSLEKLMLDWDETIPGERAGGKLCSKRQWNHHQHQQPPPFPSDSRAGYGRRKRADMSSPPHMLFPASPPFLPRKTPAPRQARNTRSPSVSAKKDQSARKAKLLQKMPASSPAFVDAPDCALDYGYSGDNPVPTAHTYPVSKGEQKEYCGLYSPSCSRSMPDDTNYPVSRFALAGNDIGEAVSGMYPELKQGAGPSEQLSVQQSMGQDHERLLPDTRELFPLHAPGYGANLDPTDAAKKLATFYDVLDNSSDLHPPASRQLLASQLQFEAENASVLETNARYLQNSAAYSSLEESKKDAELSSLFAMQRRNNRPQNAVAQLEKQAQKLALDYGGSPYSSATMANASPASSDSSIHLDGNYSDKQGGRRVAPMGLLMEHGQEELYPGSASQ